MRTSFRFFCIMEKASTSITRERKTSMKCNSCGVEKKDLKPEYSGYGMYSAPVTSWICSSCEAKAKKKSAEIAEKKRWKGRASCPACKGKLRAEGDIHTSISDIKTIAEAVNATFEINPIGMAKRLVIGIGKAAFSVAKDEKESKVRQCSKCEAYATKCPTCAKVFIVGRPKVFDGVSGRCPKCGQRVVAYS